MNWGKLVRCERSDLNKCFCNCPCGGNRHGKRRGSLIDLPFGDPHSPRVVCPMCGGSGKEKGVHVKFVKCWKCFGSKTIIDRRERERVTLEESNSL